MIKYTDTREIIDSEVETHVVRFSSSGEVSYTRGTGELVVYSNADTIKLSTGDIDALILALQKAVDIGE